MPVTPPPRCCGALDAPANRTPSRGAPDSCPGPPPHVGAQPKATRLARKLHHSDCKVDDVTTELTPLAPNERLTLSAPLEEQLARLVEWLESTATNAREGTLPGLPYLANGMFANDCTNAAALVRELVVRDTPSPTIGSPPWPDSWLRAGFNGCLPAAAEALRYLSSNERPSGGEQRFNAAHLLQLADELDTTRDKLIIPTRNT